MTPLNRPVECRTPRSIAALHSTVLVASKNSEIGIGITPPPPPPPDVMFYDGFLSLNTFVVVMLCYLTVV